jgi:hypothetical protein
VHPKRLLYEEVYRPFVAGWFALFAGSRDQEDLVRRAGERGLLGSLQRLNELGRGAVDGLLDDGLVANAYTWREAILWVGDEGPGPDPTLGRFRVSLANKLRRNLSLGVLEAVLCLQSACGFARADRGLRGDDLARTLLGSRQLYSSLAALHDRQECARLTFLTGLDGCLEYPATDFADIVAGRLRIASDKFAWVETAEVPRLRFVPHRAGRVDEESSGPTMRCPAQRVSGIVPDLTYNDVLWNLLIEIYRHSGQFHEILAPEPDGTPPGYVPSVPGRSTTIEIVP